LGQKVKKFSVEGQSPLDSPTSPQPPLHSAPAAPRPIFANPPVIFFTILTLDVTYVKIIKPVYKYSLVSMT